MPTPYLHLDPNAGSLIGLYKYKYITKTSDHIKTMLACQSLVAERVQRMGSENSLFNLQQLIIQARQRGSVQHSLDHSVWGWSSLWWPDSLCSILCLRWVCKGCSFKVPLTRNDTCCVHNSVATNPKSDLGGGRVSEGFKGLFWIIKEAVESMLSSVSNYEVRHFIPFSTWSACK